MRKFEHHISVFLLDRHGISTEFLNITDSEEVEYTGAGYYLSVRSAELPVDRIVLSEPKIAGKLGGVDVGFLAFIEKSTFTLECFSYNAVIQETHRNSEFVPNDT